MPPPSNRKPFPDKAHEDLATWVEETIAGLGTATSGVSDAYFLTDLLFSLLGSALTDIDTGSTVRGQLQQRVTALEAEVADLTSRVTALEAPLP